MTWDADNDGAGVDGNAPYAYTKGIENILQSSSEIQRIGSPKGKRKLYKIADTSLEVHKKTKTKKPKRPPPDSRKKV